MKKAIAVFAALVMVFACVLPAAAAPEETAFVTVPVYSGATYANGYHTVLPRTTDGTNTYITIADITGYLIANDTTVGDTEGGKDYNYFYTVTVEEASAGVYKVTAVDFDGLGRDPAQQNASFTGAGRRGYYEVPENGFIFGFNANDTANVDTVKTIVVGDYVVLTGVDLDELAIAEPRVSGNDNPAEDILQGATITFYHDDGTGDVSEPSESVTDESTTDDSTGTPETGDSVLVYAMIALIACAGAVVAVKVRK